MATVVKKAPHRKKSKQVNFRTDQKLLKLIDDLKIAYPKLSKTDIIHEAVERWHEIEFR